MKQSPATDVNEHALDERELVIAQALLEGRSMRDIGAQVGLHASRVCRIGKQPNVEAYIESLRQGIQEQVRRKIISAAETAADVLLDVAKDKRASATARVAAAKALLDLGAPREPVRVVHAGAPEEPIQHVLSEVSDEALDALCRKIGLTS